MRTLTVVSSDVTVAPKYRSWPTSRPKSDNWGKYLDYKDRIRNRTIAGWSATVPAGKTVKFITVLKK